MSRLPPNVQRSLAHPQLSTLIQATLAGSTSCRTGQPSPFPEPPSINPAVLQNIGRPLDSHTKAPAFYSERPSGASRVQPCAPTIEEQIHALPRHLLDSDSDSECPTPQLEAQHTVSPNPRPPGTPAISSESHRGPLPRQLLPFSNLSLHSTRAEPPGLSIDAAPFVPRAVAGLGVGVHSTQDLLTALMQAVSCDHLAGLLMEHARLLDSTCIVAAMQRLVQLDSSATQNANSVHDVAMRIASLATLHRMPPAATACLLTDLLVIKAPMAAPPTFALVAAAAEQLEHAPSVPLLIPVATALQRLQHGVSEALLPAPCGRIGRAASALLLQGRIADITAEAVPALAYALRVGNVTTPDVISVFGHSACMHANALATADIITALQIMVASHVTDSGMLNLLARAFHERSQVRLSDCHGLVRVRIQLCVRKLHCCLCVCFRDLGVVVSPIRSFVLCFRVSTARACHHHGHDVQAAAIACSFSEHLADPERGVDAGVGRSRRSCLPEHVPGVQTAAGGAAAAGDPGRHPGFPSAPRAAVQHRAARDAAARPRVHRLPELQEPPTAERGQHGVVQPRAVRQLDLRARSGARGRHPRPR